MFGPVAIGWLSRSPTPIVGPLNGAKLEGVVPDGTARSSHNPSSRRPRFAVETEKEPFVTGTFCATVATWVRSLLSKSS